MFSKPAILTCSLLICWLMLTSLAYGQDAKIDSLLVVLEHAQMHPATSAQDQTPNYSSDSPYDVYRKITRYLYSIDVNSALHKCNYYFEKVSPKDTSLFYWFGTDKAGLLTSVEKNDEAIDVMKLLLKRARIDELYSRQVNLMQTISRKYIRINQPDSANYYLILAEKAANRHKKNDLLWRIASSRAMLAGFLGDKHGEAESHEQSWRLMKKYEPDSKQKGYLLYLIADYFYTVKNWERYSVYNELLIDYFSAKKKDIPMNHMPISMHLADDNPMKFIRNAKKVLNVADSLGKVSTYMMTVLVLDKAYLKMGQSEKTIPYLLHGEELMKGQAEYSTLRLLYKALQDNYKLQGRFRLAFNYATKLQALTDTIYQRDNANRIAEMDAKYGLEKKERLIAEQKLDIEHQKLQRSYYQFGGILLGIIALLSWFYYRKRLKYHRTIAAQENALHDQKMIELKQQQDMDVMNAMLNGQEKERGRVAKDLHDGLGGMLSALKSHFQGVGKSFPEMEQSDKYQKVLGLVTNAGDEVRRVAHDIMPRALSLAGLQPAVQDLAESLAVHNIDCSVEIINFPDDCSETKEIMLFRIIQELINNIKKHSDAKNVIIQIFGQKDVINLMIEDDGKGFDVGEALKKGGMGLSSIESRVAFLNGKIVWDSVKGVGTTVNIEIPIE